MGVEQGQQGRQGRQDRGRQSCRQLGQKLKAYGGTVTVTEVCGVKAVCVSVVSPSHCTSPKHRTTHA